MSGIVLNSLQDKSIRDEKKPEHIVKMEASFYDIIGTRNQWIIQELQDYVMNINTIYWISDAENPILQIPLRIEKTINISMGVNKNIYPALLKHFETDYTTNSQCNFRHFGHVITRDRIGKTAIEIMINSKTIGYYLPSLNSFVFGNLAWHEHYVTVLMKELWPRILDKLNIH